MDMRSATAETPANKAVRTTPAPLAYTLNDATAVCGLSRSTIYRHAAAGRLRLARVGGRTLVDAQSLCALIAGAA